MSASRDKESMLVNKPEPERVKASERKRERQRDRERWRVEEKTEG